MIINIIVFFYIFKYCLFFNLESKSTLKDFDVENLAVSVFELLTWVLQSGIYC